jgi:nitrate/nitrite transporter NarK
MIDEALPMVTSEAQLGSGHIKIVALSSIGSIFEWFDFFLYGWVAVILSRNFFSNVDPASGFILALIAFGTGYLIRPFGGVVFGALGDRLGRKRLFLFALVLMGFATFSVGLLPTYAQIGPAAPWILVALRVVQGLSVGGVYGGAATYLAEHAPQERRGFYTSWLQITSAVGMALSLLAVLATRTIVGETAFGQWGWRVPFLLSSALLVLNVWIQRSLSESPVYLRMKETSQQSTNPWRDAFANWRNVRAMLVVLFGYTAGQGAILGAALIYVLFFLERTLKLESATSNLLVALSLLIVTPLYVLFGWLTDRIGRRYVVLAACLLAALTYFPLFKALTAAANPDLSRAIASAPVSAFADPKECSFQFDPTGSAAFSTSCDIVRSYLVRSGVNFTAVSAPAGSVATLKVGGQILPSFQGEGLPAAELAKRRAAWEKQASTLIAGAGYPSRADPSMINASLVILLLVVIMSYGAMGYGPMAAMLTELFPARVRYTSISLPYHIGVGCFGGFVPAIAFAIVAATGNIYSGLWYVVGLCAMAFIVGAIFLPETRSADIRS